MKNTTKPVSAVPLRVGNVPKSLKALDRWILWRYTLLPKSKTWTKTPHSARSGRKIDATKHSNGVTFMEAMRALRDSKDEFDGVGFLLGQGIGGIDVDDCIDENGNFNEHGAAISKMFRATYAEVSPSGRGFKLLVDIGDDEVLAGLGKNNGETEIYGGQRYFTITGNPLPSHSGIIAAMPAEFRTLAESMGARTERRASNAQSASGGKQRSGIDIKAARAMLDHLPFQWLDVYTDWLRAGMALHHEFNGAPEALELWDEWSQRNPQKYEEGACLARWPGFGRPGKDEVTVRTLLRDARATGWQPPPSIAAAMAEFSPLARTDESADGGTAPDWWQQYSTGPMLRSTPPAKEWIWPGILLAGKMMVLAGSGGSSKSYLMLATALQYALGNSWGPFDFNGVDPGRVLLLYGEEDSADVHERLHSLRFAFMLTDKQTRVIGERVAVLPLRGRQIELAKTDANHEVVMTDHMTYLKERIAEYKVKLVVMDPMALLHSLDENDNRAIARFVGGIDAVCVETGCSIVLVHHFSKAGSAKAREVNESSMRGASSLAAHARTVAIMHRLREDEAREWGVAEDEHSRWTMWSVVKSNYGRSGGKYWFNIDDKTGAISPAPTQLTYLGVRGAASNTEERIAAGIEDVNAREEHNAREAARSDIEQRGRMHILLQYSLRTGSLPVIKDANGVLLAAGNNSTPGAARAALSRIKRELLVDTDGMVNNLGRKWLDERELLG